MHLGLSWHFFENWVRELYDITSQLLLKLNGTMDVLQGRDPFESESLPLTAASGALKMHAGVASVSSVVAISCICHATQMASATRNAHRASYC
ncbi:hypothetical protein GUJ93_ZPchr0006g41010 [Zizania palustris]|uniref:Uncharacterized protein n=1 Tax=Zizania palustris TaxID=103762 RepID=A0A8J5TDW1_ZIZPA|nr:hypothetical protein GUJ93_ZPchr0006g41010 [Zizania palustris]